MKRLIVGLVCLWSLLPSHSAAQRGGGGGARGGGGGGFHGGGSGSARGGGIRGGGVRGGGFVNTGIPESRVLRDGIIRGGFNGLPPVGPIPPLGSFPNFNRFRNFNQFRNNGNFGDGFFPFYGSYDAGYYDGGDQGPVIVMPEETFIPFPPPPPPPPPQPELREYKWPEAGNDPSAVFTIVLNDGSSRSATAVWVQGNTVRYFTPDGTAGRMPLESVNRAATRTANVAKNLTLALPAESSGRR